MAAMTLRLSHLVLSLFVFAPSSAWTQSSIASPVIEDTEEAACNVLKITVVRQSRLPPDTPDSYEWYCDFSTASHEYLRIVALRAGHCEAASCLLGWFAVMRGSEVVLQWDVGNGRIVALDEYPPK
jgi:hypothetical protein